MALIPINWNSLVEFDYEDDMVTDKLTMRVHGIYYSCDAGWVMKGFCYKTGRMEICQLNKVKNVELLK